MQITQLSYRVWMYEKDDGIEYFIYFENGKFKCTCKGYRFRMFYNLNKNCIHILEVLKTIKERETKCTN